MANQESNGERLPVAVITGGASGIGEATVRRFCKSGWKVVLADVNEGRGKEVTSNISACGYDINFRRLDVSDETQVAAFVETVYSEYGSVDALVNSAGVLQNATRITKLDIAEFDRIMSINVRGSLLVGRGFAERMANKGSGTIVNLCSLTSYRASPQPAYGLSKTSVKMLTEMMAAEYGPHGVRVNAVAPGYTMTPAMKERIDRGERNPEAVIAQSAIPRFVQPSEVADAIYFLCSPSASAITGVVLPIDCGWLVYSAYKSFAAQPL